MSNMLSPPADVTRAIRRVLNDILRKTGSVNAEVSTILDLLEGLADPAAIMAAPVNGRAHAGRLGVPAHDGASTAALGATAVATAAPGLPKVYEIAQDDGGEARLLEGRAGSDAAPFSVPRGLYDAFARTTAAHSGRKFDAIFRRHSGSSGGAAMRDYQARVCFRFWQAAGLLVNAKGRYAITSKPEEFPRKAAQAWDALHENQPS